MRMNSKKKKLKLLINNPTIGADIEVFLKNKETQEIVSAEGIIKGTKYFPFNFSEENPFFATSLDNIMAEFCIPPAKTSEEFLKYINTSVGYIQNSIPKELNIFAYPAVKVDDKLLQTENAMLFGCDPDFNAWLYGVMNDSPSAKTNIRSCGGHIHVGYDKPDMEVGMELIKAMDIFLGLPSILQEPDNERKQLYGKAGAFRFKQYGVEYRTISNYYLASERLIKWVFDNTLEAVQFVNNQSTIGEEEAHAIQTAINQNNKELAQTMCSYFGVKLAA
jgi:hypothetical protein